MYHPFRLVGGLLCAAALLLTIVAFLPTGATSAAVTATATPTPTFTPKQQAQANRLQTQYQKLRGDMYGLSVLYDKAAGFRRAYLSFMYGQQFHHNDTTVLEKELAYSDNLITQGNNFQQKGHIDLGYPNGFDASGKSVTNINVVSNEIQAALPDYLTSRNYVTAAIFELHSGLNLYFQITGFTVPNVPKYHPPLYCLSCATATPDPSNSSANTQSSSELARSQAMANAQDQAVAIALDQAMTTTLTHETAIPQAQDMVVLQSQGAVVSQSKTAANAQLRGDTSSLRFLFNQAGGYLNTVWQEILTSLHNFLAARV